jgi:FAD/FMN-containing dehydrogenase
MTKSSATASAAVSELRGAFAGRLFEASDPGYDEQRRVHNGLVDKRPSVIAQCRGTADISDALRLAATFDLDVAVRGGGHNVSGRAVCDGGLMIDLSQMTSVRVDAASRTARVEGGVLWKQFNREAQHFGLATTGGIVGTTGVAGLTLGGGFGWLLPKFGLALDNLNAVDLVLADGRVVKASRTDHPDLFWAVRGGGGNFGVAASFEFRLHEVGPIVSGGLVAHPYDQAAPLLRFFRDTAAHATDDLMLVGALLTGPDHATKLSAIAAGHFGSANDAAAALAPIKSFGHPVMDVLGPIPYVQLNGLLDASLPRGARNYWKSHFLTELTDEAIGALIEAYARRPSPMSQIVIEHFHGALTRVAPTDTAFALRTAGFNVLVLTQWMHASDDHANIEWGKQTYKTLRPFGSAHRYGNYLDADDAGDETLSAVYGPNVRRLREIKAKYDPQNVFRLNINITPA